MSNPDYMFPRPLPVMCQWCGEFLATIMFMSEAEDAVADHRPYCRVEQRRQALFDNKFAAIASALAKEGFPCS